MRGRSALCPTITKALAKSLLVLCLTAMAATLSAAPVFKSANSYSFGWASSYTQSYTVSAGTDQIMLVYALLTHGGSASAMTYNGTALTSVGSVALGNSTTMYVYRLVNPAVTTANLVVTNGGSGNAHIVVVLYTGVDQTSPIGNTATGTNGGTDPMSVSVSHTRSSSDSTVLVASGSGWAISPAGNSTSVGTGRHFANTGGEVRSFALSDYSPGSTGSTSYTHTRTSSGWSGSGAYALELMPAAPAGSPTYTPTNTPYVSPTATRTQTPYYSPTHSPTITPYPTCGPLTYDNNAASFGSTQVGSGTWTNAWNRGSAANAVMFVVLTVSSNWSGTVTYNGVAMTLLSSVVNSNNTLVYYLVNPASGSNNIVVDAVPDDWDSAAMTVFSYSGINTSDPFLSNNFNSGTGAGGTPYTQDVAITPVRSNSVILAIHSAYNSTASTGYNLSGGVSRYHDARSLYSNRDIGFGDMLSAGAPMTVSQSFTGGSGDKNKIAFAIELNICGTAPTPTATPTATPTNSPTPTATRSSTPLSCEAQPQCTNNWLIYGDGYAISNGIHLTSATGFQSTTAWSDYKMDLNNSFSVEYDMRFSDNGVVNDGGADGIVFILQNDPRGLSAIGDNGQGLGYADTVAGPQTGIIPSVAVEFDTFQNVGSAGDENFNDPAFDHTSIHLNGNGNESSAPIPAVCADAACANIEDGNVHRVRIDWNRTTNVLSVYFDGNLRLSYNSDIVASVFGGSSCVYWGFGSATGGSVNVHEVIEVECLSPTPTPTTNGTNTYSPTITPSRTPSPAFTPTLTPTPTPSRTNTPALTPTLTPTRTASYSATRTATQSATLTSSPTRSVTPSVTPSVTVTRTPTISPTFTLTYTYTMGPTPTPAFPLVKSADLSSATIGSTITYTIHWTNDSGGSTTIHIWDTVDASLTYVGCDNSCSYASSLVSWSLAGQAAGSSGDVKFWAVVSAYPYLPIDRPYLYAVLWRDDRLYFPTEPWP